MPPPPVTREALLQLYKQLLRSCQTYPSKNRWGIYQAIREEWRDHKNLHQINDEKKLNQQITIAYKGLSQLRQFGTYVCVRGKRETQKQQEVSTKISVPLVSHHSISVFRFPSPFFPVQMWKL
jgi:hypothetical protein